MSYVIWYPLILLRILNVLSFLLFYRWMFEADSICDWLDPVNVIWVMWRWVASNTSNDTDESHCLFIPAESCVRQLWSQICPGLTLQFKFLYSCHQRPPIPPDHLPAVLWLAAQVSAWIWLVLTRRRLVSLLMCVWAPIRQPRLASVSTIEY